SAATTSRSLYDRFLSIRFITFIVKAPLLSLLLDYLMAVDAARLLARMGTLTMRPLRAGRLSGNHTHRLRLGLAKQRCLPRAFLFHYEPQDRPSNVLRSLPLVVSQRLLVARVLLPLPLLAADLGRVLLALYDCVPLCSGPKGVGNSLVDDVLQCHTALTSGRPGTSWHSTHLGSYTSSPPGRMTGLPHGAGLPSISRWVRVAGSPQRADRKSTRLNSSHVKSSYAVFC